MLNTMLLALALAAIPYPTDLRRPVPPPAPGMLLTGVEARIAAETHPHGPVPARLDEMADGRVKRLPGPSWWHCPTCGSSTCRMYLGQHLSDERGEHRITNDKLNEIGYRNWYVYHDNLHNADRKLPKKAERRPADDCPTCRKGLRGSLLKRPLFSGGRLNWGVGKRR